MVTRPLEQSAELSFGPKLGELGVAVVVDPGRAFASRRRGAAPSPRRGAVARALATARAARARTGTSERQAACARGSSRFRSRGSVKLRRLAARDVQQP